MESKKKNKFRDMEHLTQATAVQVTSSCWFDRQTWEDTNNSFLSGL